MSLDCSLTKNELKKKNSHNKNFSRKTEKKKSRTKDRQVSISTKCKYKKFSFSFESLFLTHYRTLNPEIRGSYCEKRRHHSK